MTLQKRQTGRGFESHQLHKKMITKDKFSNEGFIYDSLENYQDIFDLQKFKEIKSEIDKKNVDNSQI